MIDFILQFDDPRYKDEMIEMLENKDLSERNVLETYITKDIGELLLLTETLKLVN